MNTTTRIRTAERLGRTLGRGWRAYVRGERRASSWLVSKGGAAAGATALVWVVKLVALGVLLYTTFWLAVLLLALRRHGWLAIRLGMMTAGRNRMNCAMARRALACILPMASGSTLTTRTIRSMTEVWTVRHRTLPATLFTPDPALSRASLEPTARF